MSEFVTHPNQCPPIHRLPGWPPRADAAEPTHRACWRAHHAYPRALACCAVSWTVVERSEHRLHPAPPATDRQLVCLRTRRSSANEQLVAIQLLTKTMQGVMPTVGLPPVTENALGGTAAAPSSAPVAGAFEPSSTHCGLPEAPHQPLSVAQGPILPPSLYAAPAVPSRQLAADAADAAGSHDPPPQPRPTAAAVADGSRAGGRWTLGLSAQLRAFSRRKSTLSSHSRTPQRVATSFVRELAPLMQMQQRPLPAAAEQPPDPASALQLLLQAGVPLPQAVQLLQQPIPPFSNSGDLASLHSPQLELLSALPAASLPPAPQFSSHTPMTSVAVQGVATIPVHATPVSILSASPHDMDQATAARELQKQRARAPAAAQSRTQPDQKGFRR